MRIEFDRHNGIPVYRQIMDQIRFQIASGLLRAGSELPSTRTLAAETGLNPMTISKAYSLLEKEGVAERRPGRSLVVRNGPAGDLSERRFAELRKSLENSVRIARQLRIEDSEAADLFVEMLRKGKGKKRRRQRG